MKREHFRDKWVVYHTAALAAKACLDKKGLGSFESNFPERTSEEQNKENARFAAGLLKNMKIKDKKNG